MERTPRFGLVVGIGVLLTLLFTFPVSLSPATMGRVNSGDGQLSIWNVGWVGHALLTKPLSLWDANIFYPRTDTLAYSESNIGAGLLGLPALALSHNAVLAHNVAMLVGFVLAFVSMFALVWHLTRASLSAWLAAIAFAFCPFVFARTAHIQLMMIWGLPASLYAWHRFVDAPGLRRAVALALVLVAATLCCAYYGIFAALMMGCAALYYGWTRRASVSRSYWVGVAVAGALSLALIYPFFLPYLRVRTETGFERSLDDAAAYATNWPAWLASPARAHEWLLPHIGNYNEVLFPGIFTILAGLAGLALAVRRQAPSRPGARPAAEGGPPDALAASRVASVPSSRETAGFYALVAVLAFWSAFGPRAGLYTALFHTLPVFAFLRAPARFGILVTLSLVVVGSYATRWIAERWPARQRLVGGVLGAALVVELLPLPFPGTDVPPPNQAYLFLAQERSRAPLAEFPFFFLRSDFPRHAAYMLNSTYHWHPLINGYSDNIPDDFRNIVLSMSTFPSWRAFEILRERKARYVAFHMQWYDTPSRARVIENIGRYEQYLRLILKNDEVWLYEIRSWPE
ncbi:MAG: hypothetical protein U0Q12_07245 [Vicinamibacterales bacterium]